MKRILLTFIATAGLSFACVASAPAQAIIILPLPRPGVEELYRLDALPAFRRSIAVGSVSSYDRTGGNDDGFRGTYSFVAWLDAFFGESKGEGLRPEGLYTHNDEPDLLAPYLYTRAGRADKTQARARQLMGGEYRTGRAGLPGNDDSGTMSSRYVWNAVGLYPNAGRDFYYVGSPLFTRARINLGAGRVFTIEARGASHENVYVQSAKLDGRTLARAWLTHSEVSRGGTLILNMGPRSPPWGSASRPPSLSNPSPGLRARAAR
jgi:putative alpha-1,2-mannosidase